MEKITTLVCMRQTDPLSSGCHVASTSRAKGQTKLLARKLTPKAFTNLDSTSLGLFHLYQIASVSSTHCAKMSNLSEQLEEIKTALALDTKTNKPLAYSTLLHLQEQSSSSPASIQVLAEFTLSLVPLIVTDVHDDDEEM